MRSWEVIVGALALAAGIWGQIRGILHWLRGFVIESHWVDEGLAKAIISRYGLKDGAKRHVRERAYGMASFFVKPLGKHANVAYENALISGGVLWVKKRPVWFKFSKDGKEGRTTYDAGDPDQIFSFIRGTLDFEALVIEATEGHLFGGSLVTTRHRVHYHHGRTLGGEIAQQRREEGHASNASPSKTRTRWDPSDGKRLLKWTEEDLAIPKSDSGTMVLTPELERVMTRIKLWHKSKYWYRERGVSWRLGLMFEGVPGTGKTTMTRAAAEDLDLPIHIFDIATMSNEDLRDAWSEMSADAPCVALIEDIDAVFDGRKNISPGGGMMSSGGLTFDALLNCVDGIERHDGVLFIVTTNHAEKVDPALSNRGGRIDQTVTFHPLDHTQRLRVAENILGKTPEAAKMAMSVGNTPAGTFVEMCCRKALENLYAEKPAASDPYRGSQNSSG